MERYLNLRGDSGVLAYEIFSDTKSISVMFPQKTYHYRAENIGNYNYETMVDYAIRGYGLNSFINSNLIVKYGYDK